MLTRSVFFCFLSLFKTNSYLTLTPVCKGVEKTLPCMPVQLALEQSVVTALACGKATEGTVSKSKWNIRLLSSTGD